MSSEINWQESARHSLKSIKDVNSFFETKLPEIPYDISIPLSLAQRIKEAGAQSALWKQFIPDSIELEAGGLYDPIGDQINHKQGQLIHRYENRVLFMPTKVCPVICRYCFRKNELSGSDDIFKPDFDKTLHYLKEHPEVNEIIFSGGDPFMLSNRKLETYLEEFSKLSSIKFIRFHTRVPSTLPERIDEELIRVLSSFEDLFKQINIVIHTNHVSELNDRSLLALSMLKRFSPLSQSVLLKGVNDSEEELYELFLKLIENGVRPYYLHHPDSVKGATHFELTHISGVKILQNLRQRLPGWAIPQYILDDPKGIGKKIISCD